MRYYKLFLIVVIGLIIVLFFFPKVSAQAQTQPIPLPEAPEASVRQMIVQYADYYGFDGNLALAIAACESQLIPTARNPHGTAKGIYQFLDSSFRAYSLKKWGTVKDVFEAKDNIELGVWVLATEGTGPWLASKDCWNP